MEPGDTRNIVEAYLTYTGALATDTVTVNLVRLSGYTDGTSQVIATQTLTCTANQPNATTTFALETIREYQPFNPPVDGPGSNLVAPASRDNGIYRAVAGTYQLQATCGSVSAASAPFRVTLIPSDELRHLWLRGLPLEALDVVAPLFQPQQVTGVRIRDVSQDTLAGIYPLAFTASSGATAPTLSWMGGTPVSIPGTSRQTIVLANAAQTDYVVCDVVPWRFPTASVTETILIGGSQFTDDNLQQYVDYATGSLESSWYFFVEPHTSDTDPLISEGSTKILQARGTVPTNYHVEHQEVPMTYVRPRDFSHWMSFSLPRRQIQAIYYLFGYFNQSQAVSIGRDWIVFDPVTGTLELVPDNGAIRHKWSPPGVIRGKNTLLNSGNVPTRDVRAVDNREPTNRHAA